MIGRVASLDFFVSIAFMPVSIAISPIADRADTSHLHRGRRRADVSSPSSRF
jgi:hypothetical protein